MKKVILLFFLLPLAFFSIAQEKTEPLCYYEKFSQHNNEYEQKIFTKLEIEVAFKGGYENLAKFIQDNILFTEINKIIPDSLSFFLDSVSIRFIISKNKKMSDLEILEGKYPETREESTRLLKLSSCNWRPGVNGGRLLNAYHIETIYFIVDKTGGSTFTGFKLKGWRRIFKSAVKDH